MLNSDNYVEAETVSEDSEISSLSNTTEGTSEVRPLREGIQKVKDLIQELEESFRECNNISNNLILRCVLLRAENHNLIFKIDQKNSFKPKLSKNAFGSESRDNTNNLPKKYIPGEKSKESTLPNSLDTSRTDSIVYDSSEEIDILHNTIEDLQKKLREKNMKFEELSQKYNSLETNKIQMETDLRSQIMSLEEQLNVTNDTLTEFQNENEADIEDTLSSALDPHEALFLQERLRCSKLMYEKVRLHHEIQRLQDVIRRQTIIPKEKDQRTRCRMVKAGVDKAFSEPLMKRFQST